MSRRLSSGDGPWQFAPKRQEQVFDAFVCAGDSGSAKWVIRWMPDHQSQALVRLERCWLRVMVAGRSITVHNP